MTKCESCGHDHAGWIPKDRLDTVAEQRRAALEASEGLASKVAELDAQLKAATTAGADLGILQGEVERLKGLEQSWGVEKGILSAGLEPAGLSIVRMLWDSMPAADRPDSVGAWLSDRATLPKAVSVYLPSGDQPAAAPAPAPSLPRSSATARDPSQPSDPLSADAIRSMSLAEYKEHRGALLKSVS